MVYKINKLRLGSFRTVYTWDFFGGGIGGPFLFTSLIAHMTKSDLSFLTFLKVFIYFILFIVKYTFVKLYMSFY